MLLWVTNVSVWQPVGFFFHIYNGKVNEEYSEYIFINPFYNIFTSNISSLQKKNNPFIIHKKDNVWLYNVEELECNTKYKTG